MRDAAPIVQETPQLRMVVGLPMLILYTLGVSVGAGVHVLAGATTAKAGMFAPSVFVLAAMVMGFSATASPSSSDASRSAAARPPTSPPTSGATG